MTQRASGVERRLTACLVVMPFAWQVRQDRKFRVLLYALSLASVVIAVVFVILGFVSFDTYKSWSNGSFVGGWITSVCIFYAIMGVMAALGLRLNSLPLLTAFLAYNAASLVVRILTVILFSAHKIAIHWTSWVLGAAELLFALTTFSIITVIIETGGISASHRAVNRASTKRPTTPAAAGNGTASAATAAGRSTAAAAAASHAAADLEANSPSKSSNPFESPNESTEILRY